MSALVVLPPVRLNLLVPGATPASGLREALQAIHAAAATFPARPGPEALGAALCGTVWHRHGQLTRVIPTPEPRQRTSHRITVDVTTTLTVGVETVIFDSEDETFGYLHEGSYVLASIMPDLDVFVRAITQQI